MPKAPPVNEARRAKIVESATRLFSRYGFRRTSMDLLAAEAEVAKPTLYAYFSDKEAVFAAVCSDVCDRMLSGAERAAEGGTLIERVTGVLDAKHGLAMELVHASPHAREIFEASDRVGADVIARLDRAYNRLLSGLLDEAVARRQIDLARVGMTASTLTTLLVRASRGLASEAAPRAALTRQIRDLVRLTLRGAGLHALQ